METISDSAETAYLASLPELDNLGDEEALEAIHTQLYLGLYSDAMEGWIQWRRTGVPTLQTVRNSRVAGIIRRFFFPPDEIGANPNSTEAKPLDFPMWYEGE
jgi:hypothetical protein